MLQKKISKAKGYLLIFHLLENSIALLKRFKKHKNKKKLSMRELKIKKGVPLLNHVVLTADKYTKDEVERLSGAVLQVGLENQLKLYQTVLAISPKLINPPFKVGDLVIINIDRYGRSIQKKNSLKSSMDEHYNKDIIYEVPTIELDGKECLKLGDNDIEFVIEEYEIELPEKKLQTQLPNNIIEVANPQIILPKGFKN